MTRALVGLITVCAIAVATSTQGAGYPDRPGQPIPNQNPPQEQGSGQNWPNGTQGDQGRPGNWRRCDSRAYSYYSNGLQQLADMVQRGQYDGSYDRTTARKFNRAIAQDRAILDRDYQYDRCIDPGERSDLDARIDALKQQMRQYDRRPGGRHY